MKKQQPAKSKRKPATAAKKKTPAQKQHGENSELTVFEFAPPPSVASSAQGQPQQHYAFDPEYVISMLNEYHDKRGWSKAYALVALAVGVIRELERITEKDPHGVSGEAARRATWPVLAGRHTAINKKNEALFEQIGLGRDPLTPLDFGAVPIDLTPAKKWALQLLQLVEHIRFHAGCSEVIFLGKPNQMTDVHMERFLRHIPSGFTQPLFPTVKVNWMLVFEFGKLPELTSDQKNIQAWQKAVWDLLILNSSGHPEDIPELCAIGEHRRYHPISKTVMSAEVAKHFVPLERQGKNIAREVRENIFEEILKIARHLQKLKPPTE